MSTRTSVAAVAFVASFATLLAAAEDGVKPALPEILTLEPIEEKRPDIDAPALSEICQLQRARYNVALKEFQRKLHLFRGNRVAFTDMLDSFKRLRKAERGLPARPKTGEAREAAEHAWAIKEAELFNWLEEEMQAKFDAEVIQDHELHAVQFYHLDAKERLANFTLRRTGSSER